MKRVELVGLAGVLNSRGVKNTKKVLNNYLYFLAENKVNVKEIVEKSGHIDIKYSSKTGKKEYTLHINNTFLTSNNTIVTVC